ncbi:MAG: hypothetical protein J7L53_06055, partial [Deltaproteobacteria bacterium]|nr:hypothetical protein [Deltaproteobacteria bacterium]
IRGYIGKIFEEDTNLHNHKEDGGFIYQYPRVQYKVIDGLPVLLAIQEGISSIMPIFETLLRFQIGDKEYEIFEKTLEIREAYVGVQKRRIDYQFLSTWLALNESNYQKYQRFGTWAKRKKLLEKILIGNIISMSKSLGYTVPAPIEANIIKMREAKTSLKGTPMLGFLGAFSVNFEIPDYWGIGKSVSRGFGTIKRVES